MAISVTNSITLRNFYGVNRQYVSTSVRTDTKNGQLSFADSSALRKAIRALKDVDYDEIENADMKEIITAFTDTYNMTLTSGSKYAENSHDIKNTIKRIRNLSNQYSDEFSNLGISFDSKGLMKISDTAVSNIDNSNFKDLFGEDSDYMSRLSDLAKKIYSRVDIAL